MRGLLLSMLATFLVIPFANAAEAQQSSAGAKVRVLLTSGGHGFQQEPFYGMFDAMQDVEYTKMQMPQDADLLKPGLEDDYDCIVMYDMCKPGITPQQQQAFVALLGKGIGVVSLHHNLGGHAKWDEFRKIIGGKFVFADCEIDGKSYKKTPWSHDEHLKITVVDKKHPITRGIDDFEILDETYGRFYVAKGVKVLLKTDHPKNNPEVAWTTKYGKSPVCYLMLGHDANAYNNPIYRRLLHQAIRWAAGR